MSHSSRPTVAVVFDDRQRPETTGVYCRQALSELGDVRHFRPDQLHELSRRGFDLTLFVDDGLCYPIPAGLLRSVYWAIDTHLDLDWACERGVWHVQSAAMGVHRGARECWLPLPIHRALRRLRACHPTAWQLGPDV